MKHVPYLIILVLGIALWTLFNRNRSLEEVVSELQLKKMKSKWESLKDKTNVSKEKYDNAKSEFYKARGAYLIAVQRRKSSESNPD